MPCLYNLIFPKRLKKYTFILFVQIVLFSAKTSSASNVDIESISQRPILSEIFSWTPMSSETISKIVDPILKSYLKESNYDRLDLIIQYIRYHEISLQTDPSLTPLQTLKSFNPNLSLGMLNGSSCFGHYLDLFTKIPSDLITYPVPATIFCPQQQYCWPTFAHVTLIIPFNNPDNKEDVGYILLDPVLKMESPLIITLSGQPQIRNLKEKGLCTFFYENEKIISQTEDNLTMTYYLKEFTNFIEAGLKPILAADRKITLYSRTELGEVIASLVLLLDTNTLRYRLKGQPIKEISFTDFLSGTTVPEDALASELHINEEKLLSSIQEIITHTDLLNELYTNYINLVKASTRSHDFYIPTS